MDISSRRADLSGHSTLIAGRIHDRLSEKYGSKDVFMDVDTIPAGLDFVEYLTESVERADVLVTIIGPDWVRLMQERAQVANDFVRIEIQLAMERSIPVIPLLVGGAVMPGKDDLPEELSGLERRNGFAVDTGRDFQANMVRLIEDLDAHFATPAGGSQSEAALAVSSHPKKSESKPERTPKPGVGKGFVPEAPSTPTPTQASASRSTKKRLMVGAVAVGLVALAAKLGITRPWSDQAKDKVTGGGSPTPPASSDSSDYRPKFTTTEPGFPLAIPSRGLPERTSLPQAKVKVWKNQEFGEPMSVGEFEEVSDFVEVQLDGDIG